MSILKNKSIKKSINKEKEVEEKIYEKKEYQLTSNNSEFSLKVEIDNKYIRFSLNELNVIFNYIYKNKYELSQVVKQLNLVQSKYTSLSKLLRFVDKAYSKNKISIEQKSENEMSLIFEIPVDFEEEKFSLILRKKYLDDKELLSILIDQINKLNDNNSIVKNKINEIENQINTISRKNSANRGSEGSDINDEINIIKQQLNVINLKLSGTKIISDNIRTRNNNNDKNNLKKSTISKMNDKDYTNNYNTIYKSQRKNNEISQEKEDEKFNYNKNKTVYNNERYNNNKENELEKNNYRTNIKLKKNKKIIKMSSIERNQNGGQDEYEDINQNLKKSNREPNELKKSIKIQKNEDIKEEEKYINNNIMPKIHQRNKREDEQQNINQKYYIINNSIDNDNDMNVNTNNDSLYYKFNNSNNDKKYTNNLPIINPRIKSNNNNIINQKQYKINQSKPNTLIKENNQNNEYEEKRNSKIINQSKDNSMENGSREISKNRITYVEKTKKEMEDYLNKVNYNYSSSPLGFKYKTDICKNNTSCGWNDMFEIFISYQNNKEYLASPDNNNFNINIISILDNKLVNQLKGHKNKVRTIRYFINEYNNNENNNHNEKKIINEYLISADDNHIVIVWDILNYFEVKQKIDTNYEDDIYSCLIFFDNNITNNQSYIISSTYSTSNDIHNSATKIYSLESSEYICYIKESNFDNIYYLLLWYNQQNKKNYLIQFSFKKILINNLDLKDNEIYAKLTQEPENEHFSGFIFSKNNFEYLCTSCYNGFIHIWDLCNKKIVYKIDTKSLLCHIIKWNEKYAIAADYENKSFIIIDLNEKKIYNDISIEHTLEVKCVKKLFHPKYGECLLTAGRDSVIKLWRL